MAFSPALKLKVRRRAHFECCICFKIDVEVHHIIPEAQGGPDIEDNAAPLCAYCHSLYGNNPDKRNFIRQRRDWWYEVCEQKYPATPQSLDSLQHLAENTVTKKDLNAAVAALEVMIQNIKTAQPTDAIGFRNLAVAANTASSMISSTINSPPGMMSGYHASRACAKCLRPFVAFSPNALTCQSCAP